MAVPKKQSFLKKKNIKKINIFIKFKTKKLHLTKIKKFYFNKIIL